MPGNDDAEKRSRDAFASESFPSVRQDAHGGALFQAYGKTPTVERFSKRTARRPRWSAMERREAPGSWATPRERALPPARASGVARATDQSACANRLLRARCTSRRSTDKTTTAFVRQIGRGLRRIIKNKSNQASILKRDKCQSKSDVSSAAIQVWRASLKADSIHLDVSVMSPNIRRECPGLNIKPVVTSGCMRANKAVRRTAAMANEASLQSSKSRRPRGWRRGFH
jgi:hypothetical protein